jgi:probable F420-dependent oxidoreductase
MKFGITLGYGIDQGVAFPEYAVAGARMAEQCGFESVWIGEHVVIPEYESVYPFTENGRMPIPDECAIPDPLTWLAFIAGATTTIRLGTGVMMLPQRSPVLLAKETATLDRLSGGRLQLGFGVGWLREESEALGIPFERRGARMDEHIGVLRALWRESAPTIRGEFTSVEHAAVYPKPVQPGGPPIIIGGATAAAARRAGRLGDGFYPFVASVDELAGLLEIMGEAAHEAGRDPADIEVSCGSFSLMDDTVFDQAAVIEEIKRYEQAGVDRFILFRLADLDEASLRRSLESFADAVITPGGAR